MISTFIIILKIYWKYEKVSYGLMQAKNDIASRNKN